MTSKSPQSIVLIQSRLSSNRLPGKALLPIKGIPTVVLAAKRAANTGRKVFILTSNDESDDELCETIDRYNIPYYRGSLNNVLERFSDFLSKSEDKTLVFRLTADNVFPDGKFLDEMENEFIESNIDILRCDPEKSDLPYGLSAELTTAGFIKQANRHAESDFEKEHVTPYIYKHGRVGFFKSRNLRGYKHFRVTIDSFDDYISVSKLFKGVFDPVNVSIHCLFKNLRYIKYHPYYDRGEKMMTLGTVQFGLDYGITNEVGRVNTEEAIEIIKHAITEGIEFIDTAAAYGISEKVIGKSLRGGWDSRVKIISKLSPFSDENTNHSENFDWKLAVRNSVLQTCVNLQSSAVNTIMLHRAEHLKNYRIMDELHNIKEEGLIENIGVSVQNPDELEASLSNDFVSIIQLPFNILDHRWDKSVERIREIKSDRNLIIHARSALLQGLLCSNDRKKWERAGISNSNEIISWLNRTFKEHEKMSVADLCIGYVNSQDWVDSVVVGVESRENLFKNLQSISMPLLTDEALKSIAISRPEVNINALNPSNWM